MRILSIQEAFKNKIKRQEKIKKLEYHAAGHCVHIGKLSPGCYTCFVPDRFCMNIAAGVKCNLKCCYCTSNKNARELTQKEIRNIKLKILKDSILPNYKSSKISFSGGGEPLLYLDVIAQYMKFFRDIEKYTKSKPWYFLYTNGVIACADAIMRLRDLGFDEIRFHLGASNFSNKVYKNLETAVRYIKVITVETPAWPPHRKKLFEMLPIIDNIGVKHLNIGEIEINSYNYKAISKALPNSNIYHGYELHLDDGGLVYDISREVLSKKYSYSVLDCNSFVKKIQRSPGKFVCYEDIKDLCAYYP